MTTHTDPACARGLFAQLLGDGFAQLPDQVRALHGLHAPTRWAGECVVVRGGNPLARLCGWAARLPAAGSGLPTCVVFARSASAETWSRDFAGAAMRSRMWAHRGRLRERLGLLQFDFALGSSAAGIQWETAGVRLFGLLPLPAAWFARVQCLESEDAQGRYTFDVSAQLPLIGQVVRYQGWLLPANAAP
jgi:hypothetical protein